MYAVVKTGGKQYKVAPGDLLRVEKLDVPVGETITLEEVTMISGEDGVVLNPEALSAAKVVAEVVQQSRHKKIRVFKMKRRKNYHRTYGHRQHYTELRISDIQA